MMPNATLASYTRTMQNDRDSSDLRRYAHDEWRSQVHWIRGLARPARLRQRVGRWLRRGFAQAVARAVPVPASPDPFPVTAAEPEEAPPCPHPAREELGLGGTVSFLRCCVCGDVLIVSGSRAWVLDGDDSLAAADASA